jgi:hypothetical protein
LWLGDTILGTGHLRCVSRDEVEHGLSGIELGDGRKDTTSITCQENDVGRVVVTLARNLGVADILNGIGATSVLRECCIIVVDLTGFGVEDNVFQDGSESDGVENIWLLLGRETNAFGIAASLNVEDTLV